MTAKSPNLCASLTPQIETIIRLGPLHAITWTVRAAPDWWMQVSVHDGRKHYLMLQVLLPPHISSGQCDRALREFSWRQRQVDGRVCLVYYLGRANSTEKLLAQSEEIAEQCAAAMSLLWNVTHPDQIAASAPTGPTHAVIAEKHSDRLLA